MSNQRILELNSATAWGASYGVAGLEAGAKAAALTNALLVGGPIAAAYAILANLTDLGGTLTAALYLLVVAIPVVLAAELDAGRRGASTRLSRYSRPCVR